MALYIPPSDDIFGWIFLILVGLLIPLFIILHVLQMPLSYGKFTEEGFSKRVPLGERKYDYRKSMMFIHILPLLAFVVCCIVMLTTTTSDEDGIDSITASYFMVAVSMITIYFLKRILEIMFVHQYSHSQLALSSVLMMTGWRLFGFVAVAQSICSVVIDDHDVQSHGTSIAVGLCLYIPGMILNHLVHQQLAYFRVNSSSRNYLQLTELPGMYEVFICPQYVLEMVTFIGVMVVLRTLTMLLLLVAMTVHMALRTRDCQRFYQKHKDDAAINGMEIDKDGGKTSTTYEVREEHELNVNAQGIASFATIGSDIKLSEFNDVDLSTEESQSASDGPMNADAEL